MHETPPEETDLIARFRAGDEAAFRTLFERHERLLRAWLVGRIPPGVRRRFSAADALQEACMVAFRERMGRSRDATKKLYGRALSKLRQAVVPDGRHDALG